MLLCYANFCNGQQEYNTLICAIFFIYLLKHALWLFNSIGVYETGSHQHI